MTCNLENPLPAALTIVAACAYTGLTRTYLYENRNRLDWRKAGRRSLITRASLDQLLATLPRASSFSKLQANAVDGGRS
jgi:hypothetical protein